MTAKVINFELLYADGDQSASKLAELNCKMIMADLTVAAKQGYTEIVGLLLLDGFLYKNNDLFFQTMRYVQDHATKIGIKKITLMPGMCENFKDMLKSNGIDFDISFFDFTHWMIYNSYSSSLDAHKWNNTSNKFLFLGGIPSRHNRITLLDKFYQANMLNDSEWSFFPPWSNDDKEWCRSALSHYSDVEYDNFLNQCSRSIDNKYEETKEYSKLNGTELKESNIYDRPWLKDPGYIDHNVFYNTAFSVISEGNAYPPATDFYFLTEKTWRAVANKHPFIIAGYPEQVKYAQQRGLKTFEEYFLIKDFYLIDNEMERLDAIAKNTKYFLENYSNNKESINADIEHNFKLFLKIAEENKMLISKFTNDDANKYFYQKGFSHLIRIANGN